jgi:hypothetical protein
MQSKPSKRKGYTWPVYLTTLRARRECPVVLLVLCPDDRTAARCADGIDLGHPGLILRPLTLSITDVPAVTDHAKAQAVPELAVLSAIAHGNGARQREVLEALRTGLEASPPDIVGKYYDYALSFLDDVARQILEQLMAMSTWKPKSDFAREYYNEGLSAGEVKGTVKGERDLLFVYLAKRGWELSAEQRERILSCEDPGLVKRWFERAMDAQAVDEIFG